MELFAAIRRDDGVVGCQFAFRARVNALDRGSKTPPPAGQLAGQPPSDDLRPK